MTNNEATTLYTVYELHGKLWVPALSKATWEQCKRVEATSKVLCKITLDSSLWGFGPEIHSA